MYVTSKPSGSANHPSVSTDILPAGYTLISGGAKLDFTCAGNLLVESYPSYNVWNVVGKDHIYPCAAIATAYAIGIRSQIPGFVGELEFNGNYLRETYQTGGSGNYYPSYNSDWGWPGRVVTGVGARSTYSPSNSGRLITGLRPNSYLNPSNDWSSKDCNVPSTSGTLDCWLMVMQKMH